MRLGGVTLKGLFAKRFAFTLAEVLITLGIIGVVAAMTIPTLVNNYQKKVVATGVKKAYSELNQVLNMAIAEHGEPAFWAHKNTDELATWVQTYIVPYIDGVRHQACSTNKKCLGLNLYYPLHATNPGSANTLIGQYVLIKKGNPTGYAFFRYNNDITRVRVYVGNPTKKYAMHGKDIFTFILTPADNYKSFKPYGIGPLGWYGMSNASRETLLGTGWGGCNKNASGSGYFMPGDACAAVIMLDNWEIKEDYPW